MIWSGRRVICPGCVEQIPRVRKGHASVCSSCGTSLEWLYAPIHQSSVRRRTELAEGLALRLLPPTDRQRYRQEWGAELADLPQRDQVAYAYRLVVSAWSLRRVLSDKPSRVPHIGLAVMVVIPGADVIAAVCGLGWPAAAVGISWGAGVVWTVSSEERTANLVSLIKELRRSSETFEEK